jgi:predicted amidohydrolase
MLCGFHSGRVHELLINSKKASISPVFEVNVERFLCLRFSITHTHDPKSEHWKTIVRARAIENQIPHIACNRIGSAPTPGLSYFGNSMIVDSLGEVMADAGDKECVIVFDIDLSAKDEVRQAVPVFKDRREELYS